MEKSLSTIAGTIKVSLFVHDLSKNPIGRADTFIRVLTKIGYYVEIIGFTINKKKIWEPYAEVYNYKTIHIKDNLGSLLKNVRPLARQATGDLIFSFKPIATSFLPALLASRGGISKPLLLDIEDDEYGVDASFLKRIPRILAKDLGLCVNPMTNSIMNTFVNRCAGITVVSKKLHRFYGGKIVLTTPDMDVYNPDRNDLNKYECRRKWNLPISRTVVLFVGSPAAHKGLIYLSESIRSLSEDIVLVLVGKDQGGLFAQTEQGLRQKCIRIDAVNRLKTPELLSASDMVVLPQVKGSFAEAQVPAKLMDAMAMRKTVITTDVSDMKDILGYYARDKRGWVVQSHEPKYLAETIKFAINNPDEAARRGTRARQYLLKNHSDEKVGAMLAAMFNRSRKRGRKPLQKELH